MLTHTMMTQQHVAIMRNRNEAYTVKCTANNEQLWIAAYEDPVQGYEHRKLEAEQLKWKCAKQKWNGLIMHLYCEYPLLPLFQHKAQVEYYYHSILNVSSRSRKSSRPFFLLALLTAKKQDNVHSPRPWMSHSSTATHPPVLPYPVKIRSSSGANRFRLYV